jgi:NAD(P)-dependent dehydrogenase (short-subunit alcohol dehydrogenase family)
MFSAGVRAPYQASQLAARTMVAKRRGLIVNISFWAAQKHIANVAYGVSKAATDKMTADMATELRPYGVAVVSLYPGHQPRHLGDQRRGLIGSRRHCGLFGYGMPLAASGQFQASAAQRNAIHREVSGANAKPFRRLGEEVLARSRIPDNGRACRTISLAQSTMQ